MKIGGKLQRVPNEGGQGRNFSTLVLVVVGLDAAKLFFGGGRRGKYSYASDTNKRLQNLKLTGLLVKVNHQEKQLVREEFV